MIDKQEVVRAAIRTKVYLTTGFALFTMPVTVITHFFIIDTWMRPLTIHHLPISCTLAVILGSLFYFAGLVYWRRGWFAFENKFVNEQNPQLMEIHKKVALKNRVMAVRHGRN